MKPKAIRGKKKIVEENVIVDDVINGASDIDVFNSQGEVVSVVENAVRVMKKKNDSIDGDVLLPSHLEGKDLLLHLQELKGNLDRNIFAIAETVYYIHMTKAYEKKYADFESFVYEVFGRESRSAYYYVQLHDYIVRNIKSDEDLERIKKIGYTKSLELAKANIKPDELPQYLEMAEHSSTRELKSSISQVKKTDKIKDGEKEKDVTSPISMDRPTMKSFSWMSEQYEIVYKAIETAKKMGNTSIDSQAMYLICLSYLNDIQLQENPEKNLIAILQKIENLSKIKLVAINPKNQEVLYGKELLED